MALERYDRLSAGDIDARIATTLEDLGLPGGIVDQEAATLSGGQAARVALAAIVLSRFDVTLLDEPTNDLDFDGLERLEAVRGPSAQAAWWWCPTTAPFSMPPSRRCWRSTSTTTAAGCSGEGGRRTSRSGPRPAARPRRPTPSPWPSAGS